MSTPSTCPFCHTSVPWKATVCTGCQAEAEYGSPAWVSGVLLIASAVIGYKTATFLPESLHFLGWIVGGGLFVAGSVYLSNMFAKRVVFRRIARTR